MSLLAPHPVSGAIPPAIARSADDSLLTWLETDAAPMAAEVPRLSGQDEFPGMDWLEAWRWLFSGGSASGSP